MNGLAQNPKLAKKGYVFCENLFDIFDYCYVEKIDVDDAIYECEIGDKSEDFNGIKITDTIKLVKRLSKNEIIELLNNN